MANHRQSSLRHIAIFESNAHAPQSIDSHSPLPVTIARELVKTHAFSGLRSFTDVAAPRRRTDPRRRPSIGTWKCCLARRIAGLWRPPKDLIIRRIDSISRTSVLVLKSKPSMRQQLLCAHCASFNSSTNGLDLALCRASIVYLIYQRCRSRNRIRVKG